MCVSVSQCLFLQLIALAYIAGDSVVGDSNCVELVNNCPGFVRANRLAGSVVMSRVAAD